MAKLIVISWRAVPSQVVVKQGRDTVRVQLSARFQEAVDRAAMRAGKGKSDAYIADWKRAEPRDCGDDLKAEAIAEVARIEAQYSNADLERLIRAKGLAAPANVPAAAADTLTTLEVDSPVAAEVEPPATVDGTPPPTDGDSPPTLSGEPSTTADGAPPPIPGPQARS